MPDLEKLVDLCRNLDSWLRADKENVIVLHCTVRPYTFMCAIVNICTIADRLGREWCMYVVTCVCVFDFYIILHTKCLCAHFGSIFY